MDGTIMAQGVGTDDNTPESVTSEGILGFNGDVNHFGATLRASSIVAPL
jgi:hypothetical protein